MSLNTQKRIGRAVFVGLSASFLTIIAWMAVEHRFVPNVPQLLVVGLGIAALLWLPVAPLAKLAARSLNQVTAIDTILISILFFLGLQVSLFVAMTQGTDTHRIDGEACNGREGRKLVIPDPGPGIYWACVPIAEYDARKQAIGDSQTTISTNAGISNEERFRRLIKLHVVLKSVLFGTVGALTGWFYAFGWRWRVRKDTI